MNTKILMSLLFTYLCLIWIGCEDDKEIFFDELKVEEEKLDAVHPNTRDKPYPREGQLLYINPCPLIVPQELRPSGGFLEFELSRDMNFPEEGTFRSGKKPWNMYNVHKELAVGDWYWRYRATDSEGKTSLWSEVIRFTITGKEEVFVTPAWSECKNSLPAGYPRTMCFLDKYLPVNYEKMKEHVEYQRILVDVEESMKYKIPAESPQDLPSGTVRALRDAFVLTGEQQYMDKMLAIARDVISKEPSQKELIAGGNFAGADRALALSQLYDYTRNQLNEAERTTMVNVLSRVSGYYFNNYKGSLECKNFDNHVWQLVLQSITQTALAICHESEEAMTNLEYAYEVWTARAPNTGFNRDGAWINGNGYFAVNIYTLFYMPMLFTEISNFDFLKHPWYQNAGKAMTYASLPGTNETSFGDMVGDYGYGAGGGSKLEFTDFLARELHNSYSMWVMSKENRTSLLADRKSVNLRLYRMLRGGDYYYDDVTPELDNYVWHQDIGSGIAFSDMEHPESNLGLAFRSSPCGSGSHTLADQNSFKVLYKGDYVYRNSGRYTAFSDAHNLMQYRHTRGHNTIMINGIGQAFTTESYGNITQGLNGDNLAFFLGDASNAYKPFSSYWDESIKAAGFAQTPEYGFGENPLNNYKRYIFMLRPDKILIYDDLGADEPATWQWLLHSDNELHINGNRIKSNYTAKNNRGNFVSIAEIFSEHTPSISVTNEWFMGIIPNDKGYIPPKQWHLTANFAETATNRILTVIQVNDSESQISKVWNAGNNFEVGDWHIVAEMDSNKPAAITITNDKTETLFSYGTDDPVINSQVYQRTQEGSSVLYDAVKGVKKIQEVSDHPLHVTRSAN